MDIRATTLSLRELDKCVSGMPDDALKRDLKRHVHDAYQLLLEACIKRNAAKDFSLSAKTHKKTHINPYDNGPAAPHRKYLKTS